MIGIGGGLSMGKSIYVRKRLEDHYLKGKKIISLIHLMGIKYEYLSPDAFITYVKANMKNQQMMEKMFLDTVFFCDEIRVLINAHKSSSNVNDIATQFFMMAGKLDCEVYFTFQRWTAHVDVSVRDVTDQVIECTKYKYDYLPGYSVKAWIPHTSPYPRILRYSKKENPNVLKEEEGKLIPIRIVYEEKSIEGPNSDLLKSFIPPHRGYFDPQPFYDKYNTREVVMLDREKYMSR